MSNIKPKIKLLLKSSKLTHSDNETDFLQISNNCNEIKSVINSLESLKLTHSDNVINSLQILSTHNINYVNLLQIPDIINSLFTHLTTHMINKQFQTGFGVINDNKFPFVPIEGLNSFGHLIESSIINFYIKEFPKMIQKNPIGSISPDFFCFVDNWIHKEYELEIKTYNNENGASFDISPFQCYIDQLFKPGGVLRKLFNTRYLIISYKKIDQDIVIKNIYFKPVWKIVNYDEKYPISMQVKKQIWHNIRPSSSFTSESLIGTPQKFIDNIIKCIDECPNQNLQNKQNKDKYITEISRQFDEIKQNYII